MLKSVCEIGNKYWYWDGIGAGYRDRLARGFPERLFLHTNKDKLLLISQQIDKSTYPLCIDKIF